MSSCMLSAPLAGRPSLIDGNKRSTHPSAVERHSLEAFSSKTTKRLATTLYACPEAEQRLEKNA